MADPEATSNGDGIPCEKLLNVTVRLTTLDARSLFEELPRIEASSSGCRGEKQHTSEEENVIGESIEAGAEGDPVTRIVVDASKRFQTMVGFGAALTDSSAFLIQRAPEILRRDLLLRLFGNLSSGGISLNFLRLTVGVSDFSPSYAPDYVTYDEVKNDFDLDRFQDWRIDSGDVLATLHNVTEINPNLRTIASPWTAPLWMKTESSLGGGTLENSDKTYRALSIYLRKYLVAYQEEGVRIDYLTLQNEPGHGECRGMPCMRLDPRQEYRLALEFDLQKRLHHLETKLLAYDHNWAMSWGELASLVGWWLVDHDPLWLVLSLVFLSIAVWLSSRSLCPAPFLRLAESCKLRVSTLWSDCTSCASRVSGRLCPSRTGSVREVEGRELLALPGGRSQDENDAQRRSFGSFRSAICCSCKLKQSRRVGNSRCCSCCWKCLTFKGALFTITCTAVVIQFLEVVLGIWGRFGYLGPSYPISLLSMPGMDDVFMGVAWHCYGGSASEMSRVAKLFESRKPQLEHHITECSGGEWQGGFGYSLIFGQKALHIDGALNNASSVIRWNLALDEDNGPRCHGGSCCPTCRGIVTIPSDADRIDNVTFTVDYYGLAHHSAFLEPGAQRIFSSVDNEASSGQVHAVAYRNPTGTVVLVALNEDWSDNQTLQVKDLSWNGTFEFSLPPGVATFVWDS